METHNSQKPELNDSGLLHEHRQTQNDDAARQTADTTGKGHQQPKPNGSANQGKSSQRPKPTGTTQDKGKKPQPQKSGYWKGFALGLAIGVAALIAWFWLRPKPTEPTAMERLQQQLTECRPDSVGVLSDSVVFFHYDHKYSLRGVDGSPKATMLFDTLKSDKGVILAGLRDSTDKSKWRWLAFTCRGHMIGNTAPYQKYSVAYKFSKPTTSVTINNEAITGPVTDDLTQHPHYIVFGTKLNEADRMSYGVVDGLTGEYLVMPAYDEIRPCEAEGLVMVRRGEQYRYVDMEGKQQLPRGGDENYYFSAQPFQNGYALVKTARTNGYVYIDAKGTRVHEALVADSCSNINSTGVSYIIERGDDGEKHYGYFVARSDLSQPLIQHKVADYFANSNKHIAKARKDGLWGVWSYDLNRWVIAPQYESSAAIEVHSDFVKEQHPEGGYTLRRYTPDGLKTAVSHCDNATLYTRFCTYSIGDSRSILTIGGKNYQNIGTAQSEITLILTIGNLNVSSVRVKTPDDNGKETVQLVDIVDEESRLYGRYEAIGTFSKDSFARVKRNGRWGFIDRKGSLVVNTDYRLVEPSVEGISRIKIDESGYTYYNIRAGRRFATIYDNARDFSHGYATAERAGYWGLIDSRDSTVIDFRYDRPLTLCSSVPPLVAVKRDRQWGFTDLTGQEVFAAPKPVEAAEQKE